MIQRLFAEAFNQWLEYMAWLTLAGLSVGLLAILVLGVCAWRAKHPANDWEEFWDAP